MRRAGPAIAAIAVFLTLLESTSPASPHQTEEQRKALCSVEGQVISQGPRVESAQPANELTLLDSILLISL